MVSFTKVKKPYVEDDGSIKYYCEGVCKQADTKPTEGIVNGSLLLELDTSTPYFFDEESGTWLPWS